ncbi:MAG: hypothetical protein GYA24_12395, partial [Candidatus Lokiarchaeota archaeon]|nr:hypothetical protein [Candidatus Lokiarchaeota archaeon]
MHVKTAPLALAFTLAIIITPVSVGSSWKGVRAQATIQVGFCNDLPLVDGQYLSAQLGLDPGIMISHIDPSDVAATILAGIHVLVLANPGLNATQVSAVATWVASGGSVLVVAGDNMVGQRIMLLGLGCIDASATVSTNFDEATIIATSHGDPAIAGIEWQTAPAIKAFMQVSSLSTSTASPLIASNMAGSPLFITKTLGTGRIAVFTPVYTALHNKNFQLWWYTPYFLFRAVSSLAGAASIPEFAGWEWAPVPNDLEKGLMVLLLASIAGLASMLVLVARRATRRPIRTNLLPIAGPGNALPDAKPLLKVTTVASTAMQPGPTGKARQDRIDQVDKWERIGMHRQINSFFYTMLTQFTINLPWLFLSIGVYSRYVQPFPMISGATSWIGTIIGNIFVILDMAMGASMSKFFAHHRVRDPLTALKHAQVYAWWQFSIAAGQSFIIVSLATFFQPASYIGAISYFTILASVTRIPGFYGVVGAAIDAMQRFDVKIKANAILGTILNNFVGWGLVLLFRHLYKDVPRFGEAFGAGVGMYIGGVVNGAINFCVFLAIYKKLGYYPGNLFRLDFGRVEFKEAFMFGFKLTIGNMWVALAAIIEVLLISVYVANYTEELAYYN